LPIERFIRIFSTQLSKVPKIADCSQSSLLNALVDCASLGIEPDGRRAHLIPYGQNVQLIIDYKGLVEIVLRDDNIQYVHADVVCENDEFEVNLGKVETHRPNLKGDRGKPIVFYAFAEFSNGAKKFEIMNADEVEAIRQKSNGKNSTPWKDHFNEMGKKTAFRRLTKWLPLKGEVQEVIQKVDETEFDFDMPKNREAPKFKTEDEI
jgi:recombination protein RecT